MPGSAILAYNNGLLDWSWVDSHTDQIRSALVQHIQLVAEPMLFGMLIAFPLAVLATRKRRTLGPVLGFTGALYTIPSLAAFAALQPYFGLSTTTVLIPLTAYTLLILVRNTVTGLDNVPEEVLEASDGMGMSRTRRLFLVEVPLATPTIFAGVRIATVTLIGLVPITAQFALGGLGSLMRDGFQIDFNTPITVGVVLTLVLAVVVDVMLLGVQKLITPWTRKAVRS
ncbi:MAG: opuCD [Actinomycetia bacterium]|nr:opuCD [Actinomycetes bacterium]